jgi:glucokinase
MSQYDFSHEVVQQLQAWGTEAIYFVGIDVGGTNTRVAVSKADSLALIQLVKFQANKIPTLIEGLKAVGNQLIQILHRRPQAAVLAVAGPVTDNGTKVTVTNYEGSEAERTLTTSHISPDIFPPKASRFINDLESTCYGINSLNQQGRLCDFFQPLWENEATKQQADKFALLPFHYVVLAMGTGLGTALLQQAPSTVSKHTVLPLEAGHALVNELGSTSNESKEDRDVIAFISQKLYGSKTTIEFEDICSGRGLVNVYEWTVKDTPDAAKGLKAQDVVARATASPPDANALKAMGIHYKFLMRVAQTLCVITQAKGVLLAGDNQVNNLSFVSSYSDHLKQEFLNHVKVAWLNPVSIYTQKASFSFNLAGAVNAAQTFNFRQ